MADSKILFAALKPNFWNLPLRALIGVVRVFAYGIKKHGLRNYLKAAQEPDLDAVIDRYMSAILRHMELLQSGEESDGESGLPHIDHMLAGLIMLRHILIVGKRMAADPGVGNPPPTGPATPPTFSGEGNASYAAPDATKSAAITRAQALHTQIARFLEFAAKERANSTRAYADFMGISKEEAVKELNEAEGPSYFGAVRDEGMKY